ncbi:MAG: hypothetical protein KA184_23580, partial [Candidatus Hydrogenedentes bacterium]|nr:hypothetical protein [Candidatus Hydrogenedentota bacterium]
MTSRFAAIAIFALLLGLVSFPAAADPGDVSMPDDALEAAVELIIGDDGIADAVDGNWLIGDGGSSAGPGANDPDGLIELGVEAGTLNAVVGVTDLTGLEAATNLELLVMALGTIGDLTPLKDLTSLLGVLMFNCGITDARVTELLSGAANPVVLFFANVGESLGDENSVGTTGLNAIGAKGGVIELSIGQNGSDIDISGLAGLPLGSSDLIDVGLELHGNTITAGLTALETLTDLFRLDLTDTGLDDTELASVDWSQLTGLTNELYLDANQITDITPLAGLGATLQGLLSLSGNNISTGLDALESLTALQILNLAANAMDDAALAAADWSQMAALTEIYFTQNAITDITPLLGLIGAAAPGLSIDLTNNPLDTESVCDDIPALEAAGFIVTQNAEPCGPTLTLNVVGTGNITPGPGSQRYLPGAGVSLRADLIDGSGYAFDGWYDTTDGAPGTLISRDQNTAVTVTEDITIDAVFVNTGVFNLTVGIDGASTGSGSIGGDILAPGVYAFVAGRNANLGVFPSAGSFFGGWTGDYVGYDPFISVTMDADKAVTALFTNSGHILTIAVATEGSADPPQGYTNPFPADHAFADGTVVTVIAFATDPGWRFTRWDDGTKADVFTSEITVGPLTADRTITAYFEPVDFLTLTMIRTGDGTTIPPSAPAPGTDHLVLPGQLVSVEAIPDPGNVFLNWDGVPPGFSPTAPSFSFTIESDTTLTANFAPGDTVLVITDPVGNGTTDPATGIYD